MRGTPADHHAPTLHAAASRTVTSSWNADFGGTAPSCACKSTIMQEYIWIATDSRGDRPVKSPQISLHSCTVETAEHARQPVAACLMPASHRRPCQHGSGSTIRAPRLHACKMKPRSVAHSPRAVWPDVHSHPSPPAQVIMPSTENPAAHRQPAVTQRLHSATQAV
jgi:hypothetical protein